MPDAFDLFEVEPRFTIDPVDIERRHRALLAKMHPDCLAAPEVERNPDAREALLAQLGDINDAYRSLSDPIRRAEQLLRRRGESAEPTDCPELLTLVFEQRQSVDDATAEGDIDRLTIYVTTARKRQSQLLGELTAYFDAQPAIVPVPHTNRISQVLDELRYLKKLVERAEHALDELS